GFFRAPSACFPLRILDLHQRQSLGPGGLSRHAAVPRFQDLPDVLRLEKAAAHTDQSSGNNSYHIIEETVAADADRDQIVRAVNIQRFDTPHRVLGLRLRGTEALKVMFSDQILR